jgi:adenylosuccinate synthase
MLATAEVKYETLPGWKTSTFGVKTWDDLPIEAKKYVEFIETFVGVKVKYIGTGPGREHMIYREALPV